MSVTLHKCTTRAMESAGEKVGVSWKWPFSRRGKLLVMSDALKWRNWRIPYSEVKEAALYSMPSLWRKTYVLVVKTEETTYQFGPHPGSYWQGTLPFPVKREKASNFWIFFNIIRALIFVVDLVF